MIAHIVKELELNSSIICNNKYRDEVHELFLCSLQPSSYIHEYNAG